MTKVMESAALVRSSVARDAHPPATTKASVIRAGGRNGQTAPSVLSKSVAANSAFVVSQS